MQQINNVPCADTFPDAVGPGAAIVDGVYRSNGGYFAVQGADAYVQLGYGPQGQRAWTDKFHVPAGNGTLQPGTVGIRFRNYVAGQQAVVTAALSSPSEPAIALQAGGQSGSPAPNAIVVPVLASGTGPVVSATLVAGVPNKKIQIVSTRLTLLAKDDTATNVEQTLASFVSVESTTTLGYLGVVGVNSTVKVATIQISDGLSAWETTLKGESLGVVLVGPSLSLTMALIGSISYVVINA